jgi:osomolarity two-component system, sensor histidine kinase NIK1
MDRLLESTTHYDLINFRFGGTGLGLSICKQLVHLMGGQLKASSIFGEGSVFEFTLPLDRVKMSMDEVLRWMTPFHGRHILYLDSQYDDTGAADLMRSLGLQVFVVHSQSEAFRVSFEKSFDTVVVDAVDFVRPVRSHAKLTSLPTVLLSKAGLIKDLNKSLAELGISCIYTTPTNPVDLYPPLITALQSKEEAAKVDGMPFYILLAEDNLVNRNIAIKILKGHHHKVDSVGNGQEAFEAFLTKKYDIILMVCPCKSWTDSRTYKCLSVLDLRQLH